MSASSQSHCIFIDARNCAVKAEVYRTAERHGMRVVLVSEGEVGAPFESWLTKLVAGTGMVGDVLLSQAGAGDILVTDDAKLAADVLAKGQCRRVLNLRGQRWTASGLHPKLPENLKGNSRLRFESVLKDEVSALLKAVAV